MSISDYAHHNEEARAIWWQEEGRHEGEPPELDDLASDSFREQEPDGLRFDPKRNRYYDVYVGDDPCMWFALCENVSTATEKHPILGDVPICDRCKAKVEALR